LNDTAAAAKKKAGSHAEAQRKKKEKQAKAIAASKAGQQAVSSDQPEFTKMDIRVGVITKVWHHPEADKLFCEEIDVGEEEPRQIASGLREHYTLEQMLNRKVLVVCNLKSAKIVGFASSGMVLAAKVNLSV
jgi:methionine--tRNA ligase beta chain